MHDLLPVVRNAPDRVTGSDNSVLTETSIFIPAITGARVLTGDLNCNSVSHECATHPAQMKARASLTGGEP